MKFSYRPTITLTLEGNAVTAVNIVQYNARVRKAMGESASIHLQIRLAGEPGASGGNQPLTGGMRCCFLGLTQFFPKFF